MSRITSVSKGSKCNRERAENEAGTVSGRAAILKPCGYRGKHSRQSNDPEMAHGTWRMRVVLKDQWVWSEQSECREWEEENQIGQGLAGN